MSARRAKWHPPPPPTPRILHLPRRSSRRSRVAASTVAVRRPPPPPPPPPSPPPPLERVGNPSGILEELFDQDRSFNGDRRARVGSRTPSPSSRGGWGNQRGDSEEERWRLEAEVLRAECNFLRMEREVALQKLESNRVHMEAALRSAVQTLVSGRKKIDGEQGMGAVLQEEIEELQSKLELLHRCSRRRQSSRRCTSSVDLKPRGKSSGSNFDRKALLLRRRLEEMTVKLTSRRCEKEEAEDEEEEEMFVREIREIASEGTSVSAEKDKRRADAADVVEAEARGCLMPDWRCRLHDVEILRRKMEGMSKVMLQRMESYESNLSASSSSSSSSSSSFGGAAAAANSRANDLRAAKTRQGAADAVEEGKGFCSGLCREVVGRVMEQVRAEAQQWNQMQGMLEQVRREMEDLQCASDFWERCAVASGPKLRAATAQLLEWRQKAQASEHRVSELQTQVQELQVDVETLRRELSRHLLPTPSTAPAVSTSPSPSRPHPHVRSLDPPRRIKCHPAPPLPPQQPQQQQQPLLQQLLHKEKERRAQLCRSKENRPPSRAPRSRQPPPRRPPLQEIGNVPAFSCRT